MLRNDYILTKLKILCSKVTPQKARPSSTQVVTLDGKNESKMSTDGIKVSGWAVRNALRLCL